MPKTGVKQSKARRAATEARKAGAKPKAAAAEVGDPAAHRSVLASYIAEPTEANKQRLMQVAHAGNLTASDVQAACAAEIAKLAELSSKSPKVINAQRPLRVMIQRVLRDLTEVAKPAEASGGLFKINLVWHHDAADAGDPVRTRVVEGEE